MDQPGNGLDYDLAECLYNRFQYSSPYNNMLNSKTATTPSASAKAAAAAAAASVVVTSSATNGKNSSQLAGSNGSSSTSASASSPTSTISTCSSSTNKSNGATKNSISPSSSNQQRSADISPRSTKSSCSESKLAGEQTLSGSATDMPAKNGVHDEAEDADGLNGFVDKPNKKSKSGSFNESFSDSHISLENNNSCADEPRANGKEVSELAVNCEAADMDVETEKDGVDAHADACNGEENEKNGDEVAEDRKSRSRSKQLMPGNSSASPSPSSRSSQISSGGSYMSRSGSYNNEDERHLEQGPMGANEDLNGDEDDENLDSVSVFSKSSFDKMKTSLSSSAENAIKACFERKGGDAQQQQQQQQITRNKRKAYTNRESAASSPLQFDEDDQDEANEPVLDSLQQPLKKQCLDAVKLGSAKEEADVDAAYERAEFSYADILGLREQIVENVNKAIYETVRSFCESNFSGKTASDGSGFKAESVAVAPSEDRETTPGARQMKPSSLGTPFAQAHNLRTREKPLGKPDENARFAPSLRHQQPLKSSLPALPIKKVGERIRIKNSSGSFHMTKLLETSNHSVRNSQQQKPALGYSGVSHSVRDDLKRRLPGNGSSMSTGGGAMVNKTPSSNNFMANKLVKSGDKPGQSQMNSVKSEKTGGSNSLLTSALMNDNHHLPGRSSASSLLTPSNPLLKAAGNGAQGSLSAAANLYAAAMSHLQQNAASSANAGNESGRPGANGSPQSFNINHLANSAASNNGGGGLGGAFPGFQSSLMPSLSSQIISPNNANNANTSASSTASSIASSASSNPATAAANSLISQSQFAHHHQFLLSAAAAAAAAAAANPANGRDVNGNGLGVPPPPAPPGLLPGNQNSNYFNMAAAAANRLFTPYLLDHHNQLGHPHHQLSSNSASALANSLLAQQQQQASSSGNKLGSAGHHQQSHVNPHLGSYHSAHGHHHSSSGLLSSSHGLFRTPGKRRRTKVTDTRLSPRNTSLRSSSSTGANMNLMNSLLGGQAHHLYGGMHGDGSGQGDNCDDQENCNYDDSGVEYNDDDENMQHHHGGDMDDGDDGDETGNGGPGDDESMSSTGAGMGGSDENRNELATMPNGYMNDGNLMNGNDNGMDGMGSSSSTEYIGYQTSTLSSLHLRKAKLMFFYTRYPSSTILRNYFPDVRFNKANTAQLVKWFSNFREFFYIQMEKYARQHLAEGVHNAEDLHVDVDSELFRTLNSHYNRNNQLEIPPSFCYVIEATLKEFFKAIQDAKDQDPSWKKAIYKIIARMDDTLPEFFKSIKWMQSLESSVV